MCHLFLQRVTNPMTCEKGHIFFKNCIIENLMHQKKEKNQILAAWKKEKLAQQKKLNIENLKGEVKNIENFEKLENQLDPTAKKKSTMISEQS